MLSLAVRRCAQMPSLAARSAAAAAHSGSVLRAPGNEYPSTRIYGGEFPTHYIPAKDGPEHKATSTLYKIGATSQMGAEYGVNQGRFDYGRVEHRGLIRILRQETTFMQRQAKNFAYVMLWLVPILVVNDGREKALVYQKEHPEHPLPMPWYWCMFRFFMI